MSTRWRTTALALAALCTWQQWRACNRPAPRLADTEDCAPAERSPQRSRTDTAWARDRDDDRGEAPEAPPAANAGPSLYGVRLPSWTRSLLPQPGEDLRAYRDRMIPLAQLAVAPHRARLARSREDFARIANLDPQQRAALEGAATETAAAIQDRLFTAALGGELSPSTFKPMAGVAVARDVLDLVDRANARFVGSLRDDQRASLGQHPFDFADYLVFSTRWEDAISGL